MIKFFLFLRRRAWPITFTVFIACALGVAGYFYWFRFKKVEKGSVRLEQKLTESKEERESIQKLYQTLKEKYQNLEADRENILIQVKHLLTEKEKYAQLSAQLEQMTAKQEALTKERDALITQAGSDGERMAELQRLLELSQAEVRTAKEEFRTLSDEKAALNARSQAAESELLSLRDEVAKSSNYLELFKTLSLEYTDLKERYEKLEKSYKNIPKAVSKANNENQILIRETADMHYNLGVFYAKERNYDRALKEFQKAVDINPNDAKAHYNLGYIYAEQKQERAKAEFHFKEFIKLNPKDPNADAVENYLLSYDTFADSNVLKS